MDASMKREEVINGVELLMCKTDKFTTAHASINIAMPLDDGNAAARALMIYLISKSNRQYPTIRDMNLKLGMLYGTAIGATVTKSGESQVLTLRLSCIDDKFAFEKESIITQTMQVMLDMLFCPNTENGRFKDEDIEREKKQMLARIKRLDDDKISYAANRLVEEMCRDEIYSLKKYGTPEEINALTSEDISKALVDVLLRAPIQINAVGGFDENELRSLVFRRFKSVERGNVAKLRTQFLSEAYDEREIREFQDNINQCKLVIGMRAGMTYDRDNYAAIKVMTDIFGAGTYSKLFRNVREKESLCYYCSAKLDSYKGIILIQCGVEKENVEKAVSAIKREFRAMVDGDFDEETVNASKMSICDSLASSFDTPADIDIWYSSQFTASCVLTPGELSKQIKQVTKEEIMTAAAFASFDTVYILENRGGNTDESQDD